MECFLKQRVQQYLDRDNFKNAIFFGERLFAHNSSEENAVLLAQCYVRGREDYRAFHLLNHQTSLARRLPIQGKLIMAQTAYRMEKFADAERVAETALKLKIQDNGIRAEFHYILGCLLRKTDRLRAALFQFVAALENDPLHWSAMTEVASFGKSEELEKHLERLKNSTKFAYDGSNIEDIDREENQMDDNAMLVDSTEGDMSSVVDVAITPPPSRQCLRRDTSSPHTPQSQLRPVGLYGAPNPNAVNVGPVTRHSARIRYSARSRRTLDQQNPEQHAVETPTSVEPPAGASSEDLLNVEVPNPRSTLPVDQEMPDLWDDPDSNRVGHALIYVLSKAVYALAIYDQETVHRILTKILPINQRETAWVYAKLGCCLINSVKYTEAKNTFHRAREIDPTHLEDMDAYSSLLFLMGDKEELQVLKNSLTKIANWAPQTLCADGNYWGLIKENDNALVAFERAIQIDRWNTYPYCLCGHTYIEIEDFELALKYFTKATELNPKLPHALFGRALVNFFTQNYELAATDFRAAVQMNPNHSVFRLRFGLALEELGRREPDESTRSRLFNYALKQFQHAMELDGLNKDAYINKGKLEYEMKSYRDALSTYNHGIEKYHLDPELHYFRGLIFKRLNEFKEAVLDFNKALDLSPSSVLRGNIRAALDRINHPDDDQLRKY